MSCAEATLEGRVKWWGHLPEPRTVDGPGYPFASDGATVPATGWVLFFLKTESESEGRPGINANSSSLLSDAAKFWEGDESRDDSLLDKSELDEE